MDQVGKMTKVVQIQYSTSSGGSTAVRLQKGFLKAGIDSCIVSLHPDIYGNEHVKYLGTKARWISKADTKIQDYLTRKRIKKFGNFSYPVLGTDISQREEIQHADFIYLHWALNGFLSLKSIEQLAKLNKPLIIFLHDMWYITGGCHHSFTCEKYKTACHHCQVFGERKKKDLSFGEFDMKLKLYSKYDNIYFVAPSQWMYDCARQSALTNGKTIFKIANPLDDALFKPLDKKLTRQILNIDPSETIIAFGAVSVTSPYKGWHYLQKALDLLHQKELFSNISILIFGDGFNKEIADAIPFKTKFMGYLHDEYSTALVYNAAEVVIVPSLAETFSYVAAEALSCGTPVVGFDIGGLAQLIQHKENGYLAKYKEAEDIATGVEFCLQNHVKGFQQPGLDIRSTIKKHLELFDYINSNNKKNGKYHS